MVTKLAGVHTVARRREVALEKPNRADVPSSLPLSDRIYLRARYRIDTEKLNRFDRLGLSRDEIAELLDRQATVDAMAPGLNLG